jgi:beta-lactam-binding protein with PASTA domain
VSTSAPRARSFIVRQDWFFAVALALFVGIVVWFGRSIQDFFQPSQQSISMPALVGLTYSDALQTADRLHLKTNVLQRIPSDRYPKDVIIRQEPPSGAQVREGRQVSLVVSTGVLIFPMPDLRYESLREVGLDLSHYKLVLGKTKTVSNDEVPENHVVDQDPAPLTSVRVGAVVNVSISKGGPPSIKVPNFTNMSIDQAREYAASSHVLLGQIVWTPFGRYGPERGIVVRQRPDSGTSIDSSQPVSLQVSAGPRESGYIIRQVKATATVPDDAAGPDGKTSPTVRVQVRDETGTWNVYNAYAQPKQKLDFNLTVVGTANLDVFVNNELIDSTRLGVEPQMQEKQEMGPAPPHAKPTVSPVGKSTP